MKKKLLFSAMVIAGLSSCMNSDYDLSDIDTTSRISVNNLTLPIQIEPVTLDNILDIEDGDRIQKMPNGEYAVVEEGDFTSGVIDISPIIISKPSIETIKNSLNLESKFSIPNSVDTQFGTIQLGDKTFKDAKAYIPNLDDNTQLLNIEIDKKKADIEFSAKNVDYAITNVRKIGVEATMMVTIKFNGLDRVVSNYHVNNLKVQLPKGLEVVNKNYNPETGMLQYDDITPTNGVLTIELPLKSIDAEKAGAELKNGNFHFAQEVSAEGEINLFVKDINDNATVNDLNTLGDANHPVSYECNAGFASDIKVTTFSGGVSYVVDKPNISPVDLSSLPDVLMQSGTRIEMSNPQIYLSVTNPIDEKFGIHPQAQLTLTPDLQNAAGPFVQDITLDKTHSVFCMAPQPQGVSYTGYEGAEPLTFSNLGKILACQQNGSDQIPGSISINVYPKVEQEVVDFELKNYGKVSGKYAFYAPLALSSSTRICYDKMWDDWGDEDLDNLTVEKASLSAVVSSTIPAAITDETVAYLLGYDENGNKAKMSGSVSLPANAKEHELNITLTGDKKLRRIYGMEIKVRASGGDASLTSDQTIKVEKVKITFSGYYEKEF